MSWRRLSRYCSHRKPHSMAGIEQPRSPRSAEHARLATRRPIRPATGKRSGLTSVSGPGARYAKTTAPTAKRGNTSPTSTRARAPIVGTRMVSPASVTVTSASVSHWRSGTGAIRSSRNASLGSPAWKEITARTQRVLVVHRCNADGIVAALALPLPAGRVSLCSASTGERKAQQGRARIRADRHRNFRG